VIKLWPNIHMACNIRNIGNIPKMVQLAGGTLYYYYMWQ